MAKECVLDMLILSKYRFFQDILNIAAFLSSKYIEEALAKPERTSLNE